MIENMILRAIARQLGVDPDGETSDAQLSLLISGEAVLKYGIDEEGEMTVRVEAP